MQYYFVSSYLTEYLKKHRSAIVGTHNVWPGLYLIIYYCKSSLPFNKRNCKGQKLGGF